eukprot:11168732-Alexandrium_andersonii.AAC.1
MSAPLLQKHACLQSPVGGHACAAQVAAMPKRTTLRDVVRGGNRACCMQADQHMSMLNFFRIERPKIAVNEP